jgi:hypothetical protein
MRFGFSSRRERGEIPAGGSAISGTEYRILATFAKVA